MAKESGELGRLRWLQARQREKVILLQTMIIELQQKAADLAEQIAAEEKRTRNKDTAHCAYSPFAAAAAQRRRNLLSSILGAESKLDEAKRDLDRLAIQAGHLELADSHAGAIHATVADQPGSSVTIAGGAVAR